jgi:hypothetical protein
MTLSNCHDIKIEGIWHGKYYNKKITYPINTITKPYNKARFKP